mmetsp:Transcript_40729/g.126950  ORF Transcript_40729/g.126950 Transcript_40729/m.126950 type:complete len:395 (-) Transcript_40729:464-1648(-)
MHVQAHERASFCPAPARSLDLRQGGRRDALAHGLEVVVGRVELDGAQLRELRRQDLLRHVQHEVAALALAHPAEDHDVVDVVELEVLREGVAQIDADGLVDLARLRLLLRIVHRLLDELQALRVVLVLNGAHVGVGVGVVLRHLQARLGRQLRGAALAQVHVRDAGVGALRPRVRRGLRVQVDLDVAQLVDPTHQVAVGVRVAPALAAAHRDAHDVALADLLHRGQRRDLAVVDHLQRHIARHVLGHPLEDVHDLCLVDIRRDVREDVAPRRLVLAADRAGGAPADRVDLGERGLRQIQGVHDGLVVVVWVRVRDVPLRLLGVEHLPVLHGHGLDVALAQVEGQAAAVRLLAADLRRVAGLRQLAGLHDLDLEGHVRRAADVGHGHDLELVRPA